MALNTCSSRESRTSLSNLPIKKFFLIPALDLLSFSLKPLTLVLSLLALVKCLSPPLYLLEHLFMVPLELQYFFSNVLKYVMIPFKEGFSRKTFSTWPVTSFLFVSPYSGDWRAVCILEMCFYDVLDQHLQMELLLCTCRRILVEHCRWFISPLYGQQQLLATTQECDICLPLPSLSHLVVHRVPITLPFPCQSKNQFA